MMCAILFRSSRSAGEADGECRFNPQRATLHRFERARTEGMERKGITRYSSHANGVRVGACRQHPDLHGHRTAHALVGVWGEAHTDDARRVRASWHVQEGNTLGVCMPPQALRGWFHMVLEAHACNLWAQKQGLVSLGPVEQLGQGSCIEWPRCDVLCYR